MGVLGDRKSSSTVRCLRGVRGVHGGSTIEGTIGGSFKGAGPGTGISSFPGSRSVFGSKDDNGLRLCDVGSMETLTKCIQKQRDSYYLSLVEPLLVALVLEDSMALPTLAPTPAVKTFTLATKVLRMLRLLVDLLIDISCKANHCAFYFKKRNKGLETKISRAFQVVDDAMAAA
jgi:hypothetical protein